MLLILLQVGLMHVVLLVQHVQQEALAHVVLLVMLVQLVLLLLLVLMNRQADVNEAPPNGQQLPAVY